MRRPPTRKAGCSQKDHRLTCRQLAVLVPPNRPHERSRLSSVFSMRALEFWDYFENCAAPTLGRITKWPRLDTFRKIFAYLDRFDRPVGIVETGCVRRKGQWTDGQSTVLFDRYAANTPGSIVYSVDLDPNATQVCKSVVSERVKVHTAGSVAFLAALSRNRPADLLALDLLYLDSLDVDMFDPLPSCIHHLKELLAAFRFFTAKHLS
jgi:hypothetical protein